MDLTDLHRRTVLACERPALLEYFAIEGLFGYRTVSLSSKYAATVVIAKNGAGKTTLLGALDAFLKCQFVRLVELDFLKIVCKLCGIEDTLELKKADLEGLLQIDNNLDLKHVADQCNLDPNELLNFVINDYSFLKSETQGLMENNIFGRLIINGRFSRGSLRILLDRLEASIGCGIPNVNSIQTKIRSVLKDVEIVYLPTYRRIELPLPETEESKVGRRSRSMHSRLGLSRRSLHSGEIQFGLSDISERLKHLNQQVLTESNQGYREISANIINDLVSGIFESDNIPEEIPTKEALKLFFARLKDGGRRLGPYSELNLPDLDKIYSDMRIPASSKKFLKYFLGKLNVVMQKTRNIESDVAKFVENCNQYLTTQDQRVEMQESMLAISQEDNKVLALDRRNLAVSVSSQSANKKIPMDSLSSGEKQIISLFARLYLYPQRKLILVDEPELSLSIDWQRRILVDIVNAPLCEQVVAITHSPFVFDNALEPFATPLRLRLDRKSVTFDLSSEAEESDVD